MQKEESFYKKRNDNIIHEIQAVAEAGLVFARSNPSRLYRGGVTSSIGSYYSKSHEEEVFIWYTKFTRSSPFLITSYHLGFADWFAENFQLSRPELSLFYALARVKDEYTGMIHEDITRAGEFEIFLPEKLSEESFITDPKNEEDEVTRQVKNLKVIVGGKNKIIDASNIIPKVVFHNNAYPFNMKFTKDEWRMPTVQFPYGIK